MNHSLSQNSRYKILCKLYKKYKSALHVVKLCKNETCILNIKIDKLNSVMQEIEKFPISWNFYKKQKYKFSCDFESLIIFYYE